MRAARPGDKTTKRRSCAFGSRPPATTRASSLRSRSPGPLAPRPSSWTASRRKSAVASGSRLPTRASARGRTELARSRRTPRARTSRGSPGWTHSTPPARAALEQAVAREPQFAPAHAALAKSFAYLGEQASAARESKIAAANASSLPAEDRLLVEADAATASYAWDKAIEAYRAIVKVFPDRTDVALKLIRTYIDAGRVKDARAAIADVTERAGSEVGDPRLDLESALAANLAGESTQANDLAHRAETLADAVGLTNVSVQAVSAQCSALAELTTGKEEEVCTRADRLLTEAGDRMGVLRVRRAWAYVLAQRGRFDEAEGLAASMVVLADETGSPDARATALGAVATIAKRRGTSPPRRRRRSWRWRKRTKAATRARARSRG